MAWDNLVDGAAAIVGICATVGAAVWTFARKSFSSDRLARDVPELATRLHSHEDECIKRGEAITASLHRLELQMTQMNVTLGDVKEDVAGLRKWRHDLGNTLQRQHAERGLREEGLIP